MKLVRTDLEAAAQAGLLSPTQLEALWAFLQLRKHNQPSFRFTHVLYYLGGMIAIGAMTLFMTLGWERLGGWGLVGICVAYAIAAVAATEHLLHRKRLPIPAGITAAFVVALTPLAVYGLQTALGWWAEGRAYRDYHVVIDWRWLFMELATLACGALMLWRYRLPFLMMPVAVTLWYLSMDLTPFLFGNADYDWSHRKLVSMVCGLLIVAVAFRVDIATRRGLDYAFWLYLFGVLAFWGGLSAMNSNSEWSKFVYLCINLVMIVLGTALSRRVFTVFGGLGVAGYLGHLAHQVFKDSLMFPFALTFIGLAVMGLGVLWQRHEAALAQRLRAHLPHAVRELVETRV